jgi:hypoxanthine phosphoribosyltransferase
MDKNLRVIWSEQDIQSRIKALALEICSSVPANDLTVVGVLDDTFMFLADIIRNFTMPVSCCFMKVEQHRYGGQTEIMFTSDFDPRGRDILLISSVVATGVTLDYISRQLGERGVKGIRTCALIDKPSERRVDVKLDFTAFTGPAEFMFGYGLGLGNQYRQLPHLAVFD